MSLRLCAFLFFLAWITRRLLRCACASPRRYGRVDHTGRGGVELSKLSSGDAFLVQPVLGHVWSGPRCFDMWKRAVCGGCLWRACAGRIDPDQVIGAYYIAGVLLFLVFVEQSDVASDDQSQSESTKAGENAIPYRIFSTGALLLFLATVLYVFHARLGSGEFYHSFLPAVAVVGLILLGERDVPQTASSGRFRGLMRLVVPFSCGVLTPVIVFPGALREVGSGLASSFRA